MEDINSVTVLGRLTRDPELRSLANGTSVTSLGIAFNSSRKNSDGSWEDVGNFCNVTVWGAQGESCTRFLKKGSQLAIKGRLQSRSWEAQDGSKRTEVSIVADRVQFIGAKAETKPGDDTSHPSHPANAPSGDDETVPF